jgi:hypothetical protein
MAEVFLVSAKAVLTSLCVWSREQKFKNVILTAIYELKVPSTLCKYGK